MHKTFLQTYKAFS